MHPPLYLYRQNSYIIQEKINLDGASCTSCFLFLYPLLFCCCEQCSPALPPATSTGQSGAAGMTAPATSALTSTGMWSKRCHPIVCQSLGDWAPQRCRESRISAEAALGVFASVRMAPALRHGFARVGRRGRGVGVLECRCA